MHKTIDTSSARLPVPEPLCSWSSTAFTNPFCFSPETISRILVQQDTKISKCDPLEKADTPDANRSKAKTAKKNSAIRQVGLLTKARKIKIYLLSLCYKKQRSMKRANASKGVGSIGSSYRRLERRKPHDIQLGKWELAMMKF